MKKEKTTAEMIMDMLTIKHTGKMEGMISLSTCCLCNGRCKKRMDNNNSICSHCFAAAMMKRYKTLTNKLIRNTEILSTTLFDVKDFPIINAAYFRFESFGDLVNVIHAQNYIRMAKRNKHCTFALWTKNPDILSLAIKKEGKPKNLIVIYSSETIGKVNDSILKLYPFIDHIFTVWKDEKQAAAAGHNINCGARHCLSCLRCYKKSTGLYVNELLK